MDDVLVIPRWMKILAGVFGVAIIGAIAFAYFEPVQVLPRIRVAPGYAMIDQNGESYTSESARGVVTLYTFAPTDCSTCDRIDATMADVQSQLADNPSLDGLEVRLVTIALDQAEPDDLAAAAERSGADGVRWRWIGGDETRIRTVVGNGFRRYFEASDDGGIDFDPGFTLTDGAGIVRGEYGYQTLSNDADKLVSHMGILADEIRYSDGAAAVAYEAAHLFLCYP
jgi:protein SCO1/2